MERRVQPGPGRPRHPARHDPGHRADRDHPGRVRDGGDPLRAARALGRAERGPLGLPVQHHQEVPHPGPGVRPARAQLGHHDRAVHARLHRAAGQDLPPARARTRWAAWPRSSRAAATRRSTRRPLAKVRDDKTRESGDGFDGSWVAHPDLVPLCKEVFDGVARRPARTSSTGSARTCSVTAADLLAVSKTPGAITEAGLRNNISVGAAVPGHLARRQRRGGASST